MDSRKSWVRENAAVIGAVDGREILLAPKVFSSGSCGWYTSSKVTVAGALCQLSLSLVVVGSKSWSDMLAEPGTPEQLFKDPPEAHNGPPIDPSQGKGRTAKKTPAVA